MFYNCHNLIKVDLSSFNTQNVKEMSEMFSCCYNLIKVDLSSFNTKNVKDESPMRDLDKCLIKIKRENFIKNKSKLPKSQIFIIEI